MELWIGCVAGALEEMEFAICSPTPASRVDIEPTRSIQPRMPRHFSRQSVSTSTTFAHRSMASS